MQNRANHKAGNRRSWSYSSAKKKDDSRGRWMPLWVLPVLIVMAIGSVALRLSIVRKTYSMDQLDRQIHALKEAKEKMELRVAGLRSPRRLEVMARAKFGLNQPRTDQVISMSQAAPQFAPEAAKIGTAGNKPK